METMLCEEHSVIFGRAHSSWLCYSVLRVPRGTFKYNIFSVVQMQGRAGERQEIILRYIDQATRSPDDADDGNKDVSGP